MVELAKQSSEKLPQGIPPGEIAEVRCSFCRGTGKDPFGIMSWMSNCPACLGKGVVRVKAPYRPCPHCRGTGAIKTFTCGVCRGTGYVPRPAGPTLVCPDCGGTGDDRSNWALACLTCHGLGLESVGPTPAELRARVEFARRAQEEAERLAREAAERVRLAELAVAKEEAERHHAAAAEEAETPPSAGDPLTPGGQ